MNNNILSIKLAESLGFTLDFSDQVYEFVFKGRMVEKMQISPEALQFLKKLQGKQSKPGFRIGYNEKST